MLRIITLCGVSHTIVMTGDLMQSVVRQSVITPSVVEPSNQQNYYYYCVSTFN